MIFDVSVNAPIPSYLSMHTPNLPHNRDCFYQNQPPQNISSYLLFLIFPKNNLKSGTCHSSSCSVCLLDKIDCSPFFFHIILQTSYCHFSRIRPNMWDLFETCVSNLQYTIPGPALARFLQKTMKDINLRWNIFISRDITPIHNTNNCTASHA